MGALLSEDKKRVAYTGGRLPLFQIFFRRTQEAGNPLSRMMYKCLFAISKRFHCVEISSRTRIGGGLYIGHPNCITINSSAVLGRNLNIHKGVTIGQENRGPRKGVPSIGNEVWIGVNATIVGNITIGDDVLVAPNSYVNCDIPSHSVVLGNPCVIKHRDNATEGYINHKI